MKAKFYYFAHRICQRASQYFFDKLRHVDPFDEMQQHQLAMYAMVEKELQQPTIN